MPTPLAVIVLAAYASLAAELTLLRVSSVASSLNLWRADASLVAGYSDKYRKLFTRGRSMKLLNAAPLVIVYAVYVYPLVVIAFGPDPLGDYVFATAAPAEWTGIVLIALGRALAIASTLTLRRRHRTDRPLALEMSGPFRWSRNPGLLGMYVFVGGVWLTMPSASLAAGILVYTMHMHGKVRMEEDLLANTFGRRYAEYRTRTGRYLGRYRP